MRQFWLINGCNIEIDPRFVETVAALPNVALVEVDHVRRPHLADATDKSHHASDGANLMQDRAGRKILGTGVSIAVLDTGADESSGATGRPHLCYYPGGNANNRAEARPPAGLEPATFR